MKECFCKRCGRAFPRLRDCTRVVGQGYVCPSGDGGKILMGWQPLASFSLGVFFLAYVVIAGSNYKGIVLLPVAALFAIAAAVRLLEQLRAARRAGRSAGDSCVSRREP